MGLYIVYVRNIVRKWWAGALAMSAIASVSISVNGTFGLNASKLDFATSRLGVLLHTSPLWALWLGNYFNLLHFSLWCSSWVRLSPFGKRSRTRENESRRKVAPFPPRTTRAFKVGGSAGLCPNGPIVPRDVVKKRRERAFFSLFWGGGELKLEEICN